VNVIGVNAVSVSPNDGQTCHYRCRPIVSALSSSGIIRLGHPRRDEPRPRRAMIPGNHPVVDSQHGVWQREIVEAIVGNAFKHACPVVGQVAGGAALKWRQPGDRLTSVWPKELANLVEDVAIDNTR